MREPARILSLQDDFEPADTGSQALSALELERGYRKLAALTADYKRRQGEPDAQARKKLMSKAGLSETWESYSLTEQVFAGEPDELSAATPPVFGPHTIYAGPPGPGGIPESQLNPGPPRPPHPQGSGNPFGFINRAINYVWSNAGFNIGRAPSGAVSQVQPTGGAHYAPPPSLPDSRSYVGPQAPPSNAQPIIDLPTGPGSVRVPGNFAPPPYAPTTSAEQLAPGLPPELVQSYQPVEPPPRGREVAPPSFNPPPATLSRSQVERAYEALVQVALDYRAEHPADPSQDERIFMLEQVGLSPDWDNYPLSGTIFTASVEDLKKMKNPFAEREEGMSALELGHAYGRLAMLTASYKMGKGEPDEAGRRKLVELSGLSDEWAGHDLTARIFSASAEELGKFGVGGSTRGSVLDTIKAQGRMSHYGTGARTSSGFFSNGPASGIGYGLGAVFGGLARAGSALVSGAGKLGGLAGGLHMPNLGSFPGQAWGGLKGLISGGKRVAQRFGSGVHAGIEATDPGLSGEMSSLFNSTGGKISSFVSDKWSRLMKNAPPGHYLGRAGSSLFSITKDELGHFVMHETPVQNASDSIATELPDGELSPYDPNIMSTPTMAGSRWPGSTKGPFGGQGVDTAPAGISLPQGPATEEEMATDPTSIRLMALQNKKPAFQMAGGGMLAWAVGLGLLGAVVLGGRGRGPLTRSRGSGRLGGAY